MCRSKAVDYRFASGWACTELKEFGFSLSTLTGDSDRCSHCSQPLWGCSLASSALILEQSQCLTFAQRKTIPILRIFARSLRCLVAFPAFHSQWGAVVLTLPACSLDLCHLFSTAILIKLFQFQRGWLLACCQRWVRWLIQWGRSGLHLLALDFLILTLHKHHFFAFIYTQV